jgi:hypothetical protein
MDIEHAITTLENSQSDPLPAIEYLVGTGDGSAQPLLSRLERFRIVQVIPNRFERLHQVISVRMKTERIVARRMVVALGALHHQDAIPDLLHLLAHATFDRKLIQAAGWSLANLGEGAVMPLFSFARCPELLEFARSWAIVTLGYIADPRVPNLLRFLWQENRLQVPALVISSIIGLIMRNEIREAQKLAVTTEKLWSFQGTHDEFLENYWMIQKFQRSIEILQTTLERVKPSPNLPAWPVLIRALESK